MQREYLTIKYITVRDCFAYMPDSWLRQAKTQDNVIQVQHDEKCYYMSCNARQDSDNKLCLSATFARSLNLKENDEVLVSSVKDVPSLTSIKVIPATRTDREILELQAERIQSTLLNQIRIVAEGQPIIAWISKFSNVSIIIESLEPEFSFGKLEEFTEVHVSNFALEDKESSSATTEPSGIPDLCAMFRKIVPRRKDDPQEEEENRRNIEFLNSFARKVKPQVCRVHPLPEEITIDPLNVYDVSLRCPFNVFVARKHIPQRATLVNGSLICKVKKVQEDRQNQNTSSTDFLREKDYPRLATELIAKLMVLEDVLQKASHLIDKNYFNVDMIHSNLYASRSLRDTLKLKTGSKVILEVVESYRDSVPTTIGIFPWDKPVSSDKLKDYIKKYCSLLQGKLLLNSHAVVAVNKEDSDGGRCVLRFSPENCNSVMIDLEILGKLVVQEKLDTREEPIPEETNRKSLNLMKISMRHLENILSECEITLHLSLNLKKPLNFSYDRENILISGGLGSGKTTLCKVIMEKWQKSPYFVHTHVLDCKSLKSKKVDVIQKVVFNAMIDCVYHQPSVLFLDDLDSIASTSPNDEENTPDSINAARISDMIANTVLQCQELHYVSVIATCTDKDKLCQSLRPARGVYFFRTILTIPNLEKADRIDILQLMLGDKLYTLRDVNWDYYGNKTEGWMAQDLVDMAEKAVFAAWKRHAAENSKLPILIRHEDVETGLKNCTPMSLQGVQLYKGSGLAWSDIGGLAEVKKSLIEIIQWPLIYPEIFKNAPIKLQSGVLLYGMPGTGKTLLAKAIATECGVNLISVKGPELLSKYIGVSEESVRNLFENAQRAKPCVIFFDEFDSLAPRRGHDSTGVTDRVVNQLLTQMDGVEDREGVAVVAASSRPDLLDPALLRPGRLDKSLHCPLPNEAERHEILQALCKSQNIPLSELNLKEIAETTKGFTGADLNAILTQAKLSAYDDALAAASDGKIDASDIKVSQKHLLDAVGATRPSLTEAEKNRYDRIYERFLKSDGYVKNVAETQKATLA